MPNHILQNLWVCILLVLNPYMVLMGKFIALVDPQHVFLDGVPGPLKASHIRLDVLVS